MAESTILATGEADSAADLVGPGPYPQALIVTGVSYVAGFAIRVTFADGFTRVVDLSDQLYGEVFEPLNDIRYFQQVRFDPESETAVWPNGADFAPEFLRWGLHKASGCECGYEDSDATH